jgi:hypothetical protein
MPQPILKQRFGLRLRTALHVQVIFVGRFPLEDR